MLWAQFEETDDWHKLVEGIRIALAQFMPSASQGGKQTPHITLARLKEVPAFPFKTMKVSWDQLKVDQMNLYASQLSPEGSTYTVLENFHFVGHASS